MTQRFAPALAGLTLVGCAMDAGQAGDELAESSQLQSSWQAIENTAQSNMAAVSCQEEQLDCVADAGLNVITQIACATQFTECVADTAGTTIDCSLVAPQCLATSALSLDVSGVVDCQQEVVDCAADAVNDVTGVDLKPAFTPVNEVADEIAQGVDETVDTLIDVDVENCSANQVECILDAGLRPSAQLACAEDFTGCVADVVGETLECSVESLGCFGEAAADLSVAEVVDCQQAVTDCALDSVGDLTGVTVNVDPINEIADELAEGVDEVVVDQSYCNEEAASCLVDAGFNFFEVRECRVDFVDCSAEAVDGVLDPNDVDCGDVYSDCRANGGGIFACAAERAECEG